MPKIIDALAGLIVFGATLIGPAHAFDFEYMETEHLYNTNIKDAMEKEYYVAMQALKLKADSLGMTVRSVDVTKLKELLRNKALLYGKCYDRAIRASSDNPKIILQNYSVACVKEGLKIADQIDRRAWSEWGLRPSSSDLSHEIYMCNSEGKVWGLKTFEFLFDDEDTSRIVRKDLYVVNATDYFRVKQCFLERLKYR
jgi:hypothetical protein